MRMWGSLVDRVAEHVVEEAQEATERLGRSLDHMFESLWTGPDGTGVSLGNLQSIVETSNYAGDLSPE